MARSTQEIYDEMMGFKAQETELDALTSDSLVAIFSGLFWVIAFAIHSLEKLYDIYKEEVRKLSNQSFYATPPWWQQKVYEFQYGDNISRVEEDGKQFIKYLIPDLSKQIITRCAVVTLPQGGLLIKVAKGSDELLRLDSSELNALASYIDKMNPGQYLRILSKSSDTFKIQMDLIYDPIYTLDVVKTNVEKAINDYLKHLDFNGGLDLRKLEDQLQKIQGVMSFVTKNAQAKPEGGTYQTFDRAYDSLAGFLKIDDNTPLEDSINYIASTEL
jgi:hypothetical protein